MPASVVAGKELDQYPKHFDKAPLHLAPFPNESSTDAHTIPDEHIITLIPELAYNVQLEAAWVDTLIGPSEPPRFDSCFWVYGVSADCASHVDTLLYSSFETRSSWRYTRSNALLTRPLSFSAR
ncbi:hypothetical protein PG997_008785 [Apiospora hydei]|uniref:Uncharacterized protein n=1 Tax=Apiospora hydei TaxID=1337664 RepID=A0ABR1WC18_9PEZI